MKTGKIIKKDNLRFGFDGSICSLSDEDLKIISEGIYSIRGENEGVLSGRASVYRTAIDAGEVVIKSYKRGGLIRHINRETYLKSGTSRCEMEFLSLAEALKAGVNVCEPVAFVIEGSFFCRYWLVTKEITDSTTLADLCLKDKKRASDIMEDVSGEVIKLAKTGIHHVDLHPGNILVDNNGRVYIIDFDKASKPSISFDKLCSKYMERWNRAVLKWELPGFLNEKFRI